MQHKMEELFECARKEAAEAERVTLRKHKTSAEYFSAVNGFFEYAGSGLDEGIMVEVLYNGHIAYAATPKLTPEGITAAAKSALRAASAGSAHKIISFNKNVRCNTNRNYSTVRHKATAPSKAEIFDCLFELCRILKVSNEIIQTNAFINIGQTEIQFMTDEGGHSIQNIYTVTLEFGAVARKENIIQQRTFNGSFQGAWGILDFNEIFKNAGTTGNEALELVNAPPCPNDIRTLVLMPDQMMLQIHESVGHPLEIDRILGDERNYAGGSFIKLEDIGSFQYGSKLMNISFDPTIPNELASYSADCTGCPAEKQLLIKDGILVNGLGGLESSSRMHEAKDSAHTATANQRACSWNRPPIDRMANINLEPGTSTFDEIISSIEKGILMSTNRSWSIDDYRNKFQFGCEYAKLIENGKLTATVRDPNYRGISQNFWRSLSAVGNKDTFQIFGTPFCGKGEPNQVIYVGHGSPVCAFENVEVFGGGK